MHCLVGLTRNLKRMTEYGLGAMLASVRMVNRPDNKKVMYNIIKQVLKNDLCC